MRSSARAATRRRTCPAARVALPACLIALVAGACGKGSETALLLKFENEAGAPVADELRLFVYDEGGRLFGDERVPRQGTLTPQALPELGTLLVYPGETRGALRIHVRGYRTTERVSEALMKMIAVQRDHVLELSLRMSPAPLADGDGDGVPDEIDNCPAPNPEQGACEPSDGGPPPPRDAAPRVDGSGSPRPNGEACSSGAECTSGICADSVCCNERCEGACRSCNKTPGTCLLHAAGADPDGECGLYTCNGQGACNSSCQGACRNQCAEHAFCSGQRCVPDLARGSPCLEHCQCASATCTLGVCN